MAGNKKELVTKDENTSLFLEDRPDHIGTTRRGSEGVKAEDMSLPRLEIIQDLSPQRKKNEPQYIPGAEEGMAFNTASGELYGTEITIVPVFFRKEFLLWKDRKAGGGFGGAFSTLEQAEDELNNKEEPEKWMINDTQQHFCLLVHPDCTPDNLHIEEVVLSLSKSKMKAGRKLNTLVQQAGVDRWGRAYKFSVIQDSNENGTFFNWGVKQLGYTPKFIAELAERVYEAVKAGTKDVSRDHSGGPDGSEIEPEM